jgi:hypothetical protein
MLKPTTTIHLQYGETGCKKRKRITLLEGARAFVPALVNHEGESSEEVCIVLDCRYAS